jgi:hypothetical protein
VYGVLYYYESSGRRKCDVTEKGVIAVQAMEDDAITKSARHSGKSCAPLYFGTVMTNWKSTGCHKKRLWPLHKVSCWHSIYLGQGEDYARNTDYSTQWTKSLCDLSRWFLKKELGITGTSGILEWERLLDLALAIPENVGLLESLEKVFDGLATVAERNLASQLVRELVAQEISRTSASLQLAFRRPEADGDGGGNDGGKENADGGEKEAAAADFNNQPVVVAGAKRGRGTDPDESVADGVKRARSELETTRNPVKTTYLEEKKFAGVQDKHRAVAKNCGILRLVYRRAC